MRGLPDPSEIPMGCFRITWRYRRIRTTSSLLLFFPGYSFGFSVLSPKTSPLQSSAVACHPGSQTLSSFVAAPFGAEMDTGIRKATPGKRPAPAGRVFNPPGGEKQEKPM